MVSQHPITRIDIDSAVPGLAVVTMTWPAWLGGATRVYGATMQVDGLLRTLFGGIPRFYPDSGDSRVIMVVPRFADSSLWRPSGDLLQLDTLSLAILQGDHVRFGAFDQRRIVIRAPLPTPLEAFTLVVALDSAFASTRRPE
jgi:hypothetical protein